MSVIIQNGLPGQVGESLYEGAANVGHEPLRSYGVRGLENIEMKGRALHLSTNSVARAKKGTALPQGALNDLVGRSLTEIRTVEQNDGRKAVGDKDAAGPELPPEIATKVVHEFLDKQYRETLDQPVGRLKTAKGCEKVAEWLQLS